MIVSNDSDNLNPQILLNKFEKLAILHPGKIKKKKKSLVSSPQVCWDIN